MCSTTVEEHFDRGDRVGTRTSTNYSNFLAADWLPEESTSLDADIVGMAGKDIDGWCSIAGQAFTVSDVYKAVAADVRQKLSALYLGSQGGLVEREFAEAGHYPFVSHKMVDAERGAHGTIVIGR